MFIHYEHKTIRATGAFYLSRARQTGEGVFYGVMRTPDGRLVDIKAYVPASLGQTLLEGAKIRVDIRMIIQQGPDRYWEYTVVARIIKSQE